MAMEAIMRPGLEGVIAAETRLSAIDGEAGELVLAGFPAEVIAPQATFEEMVYLLWYDRLPDADALLAFRTALAAYRGLHPAALEILRAAAEKRLPPMDVLRIAAGTLSLMEAPSPEAAAQQLVAALPTIVAAYARMLAGLAPVAPDVSLGHAANYLYMLSGQLPDPARVRALETYLNTVSDHGFNASTFTARVIISTQSDMVSAVVGALGALKGPLHGGAPGPALNMVFEIGQPERAESYLREKLANKEVLMGFGHRVYKVRDPRADILNAAAQQFFAADDPLYTLARHVEQVALRLLAEYKPGRSIQTNVEYYTALLLHGIGLDTGLFTPTFAIARVAGWTAHAMEHQQGGRILRPLSAYTGVRNRTWTPLAQR